MYSSNTLGFSKCFINTTGHPPLIKWAIRYSEFDCQYESYGSWHALQFRRWLGIIQKNPACLIFMAKNILLQWRYTQWFAPKCWCPSTTPHGITPLKNSNYLWWALMLPFPEKKSETCNSSVICEMWQLCVSNMSSNNPCCVQTCWSFKRI